MAMKRETMPSIQPSKVPQGKVTRSSVRDYERVLEKLHELVASSRSPSGKFKVLQSVAGGNLVLTSSSKRLIPSLTVRNPVIQLLITATQGHLDLYRDGGLFVFSFATGLVLEALKSGMNLSTLAELFESFLGIICDYINCDTCAIKQFALVGNINFMSCFAKSILRSKPLCKLNENHLSYISNLLLQVFLQSISEHSTGSSRDSVFIASYEGAAVSDSKVFEGLLLEAPDLSRFKQIPLTPVTTLEKGHRVVKVAMVTVSLSGDFDEHGNVNYEMKNDIDVDAEMLDQLKSFCSTLTQSKTGVVLCQKVVHPLLKRQLQESGVKVVDRLGLHMMKYVEKLTGMCMQSVS